PIVGHTRHSDYLSGEKSGDTQFTKDLFLRFRETLKGSARINILEYNKSDDCDVYVTQKYDRPGRTWIVEHVRDTDCFKCSCMRMESFGFPCVQLPPA
ncbi:hypothetical protein PIB30_087699, partial [Stylosanthes scabra]|nr:hypothetical protein [Stylosanthes scabra]